MTVDPRLSTRITKLFGVDYPIVQTGMGWVANAALTAATSNAGGLGIIAAAPIPWTKRARTRIQRAGASPATRDDTRTASGRQRMRHHIHPSSTSA